MAAPVVAAAGKLALSLAKKKFWKKVIQKALPIFVMLNLLFVGMVFALVGAITAIFSGQAAGASECNNALTAIATSGPINVGDKIPDPLGGIRTITEEMMANAQTIARTGLQYKDEAGNPRPISTNGIVIAIATALPESGLINLPGGDRDSLGLFQQRPSQGWGSVEQISDPVYASTRFYRALLAIEGWESMDPGAAAQAVQRSAHPDRYSLYMPMAAGLTQSILPAIASETPLPVGSTDPLDPAGAGCTSPAEMPGGETTPAGTALGPGGVVIQLANVPGIGQMNATAAPQAAAMVAAAAADGITLTGGSYRSHAQQIQTRINNCGSGHYNTFVKPSSQCRPPTAIPGRSQHEWGLAIDFTNCGTRSTACYQWLAANAATYGFINLPSEPWHWSTTGR